jgi:DNA invertase Pin-like site-specific DNA recombinase
MQSLRFAAQDSRPLALPNPGRTRQRDVKRAGSGLGTTNQNPTVQLNILCAVAEFEREIIRERVTAGLAAARSRGTKLGRPNTLNKYEPVVSTLMGQGYGVCEIARRLAIPLSSAHKLVKKLRTRTPVEPLAAALG